MIDKFEGLMVPKNAKIEERDASERMRYACEHVACFDKNDKRITCDLCLFGNVGTFVRWERAMVVKLNEECEVLFSSCCGVESGDYLIFGICPKCKEHCGWEDEDGVEV